MANKELHSVVTINNEEYSITANKVANKLTIGEKTYDGSSAVQVTAADLGIDGSLTESRIINTGDGLSGGGDLSQDRTFSVVVGNGIMIVNDAVTAKAGNNGITVDNTGIKHADTSSQSSINAESGKVITGVTLDEYGHVTGIMTGAGGSGGIAAETTLTIVNKTQADTDNIVYAITNLSEDPNTQNGHYVTPTYKAVTTKAYVDSLISHGEDDPSTATPSQYYFKY